MAANSFQDPRVIRKILGRMRRVAMVGLSGNTIRPSYFVGYYLKRMGFEVIPADPPLLRTGRVGLQSSLPPPPFAASPPPWGGSPGPPRPPPGGGAPRRGPPPPPAPPPPPPPRTGI